MTKPTHIVNQVIANFRRLVNSDRIAICCSGGADSMALLFCAQKVFRNIYVIHAMHDMRSKEESQHDADVVRKYCKLNKLDLDIVQVNMRDLDDQVASEAEYRDERYAQIIKNCLLFDYFYAATGHHADDQLETMIMKICRGSGLRGLSGIADSVDKGGIKFVRPLLSITKEDIYDICKTNKIPFVEDASNQNSDYTKIGRAHV